jgi:CubicO group peptidase (beta-lactamase class C family)
LPASERLTEELGRLLRESQAQERLPSVTAAVFRGGEVAWSEALGLADVATGEEVTPDHQYRIGSITKTFTAVAIMQLRDAGKLHLDDPLGRHVPESLHEGPTIRRVLAHRSGLQRETPGEVWETMESPALDELLGLLDRTELVLPAGTAWHYSNLGFTLLGEVVARCSGQAYEDYVSERLLEPLGLTRTTWVAAPPVARGYFVDPYADLVHPERFDVDLRSSNSAGGLWSTCGDLCRWGAFVTEPDPAVLDPKTVEEMHALQVMADPERWTLGWGLGLSLFRKGSRILGGHNGGMPGHVTYLSYARRERVGSALLVSSSAPSPALGELGLELTDRAADALATPDVPWRPAGAPPAELAGVLGRWWSEGQEFVFSWRDGRLEARWALAAPELEPAVFEPDGPDGYRVLSGRERGELLRVVRDANGTVTRLYWATYPMTRSPEVFGL